LNRGIPGRFIRHIVPEKLMIAELRARGLMVLAVLASAPCSSWAQEQPEQAAERLVAAAIERTGHSVAYDGSYRSLAYPGGDVPDNIGVCTDVVIRAYRSGLGIDLQKAVHDDMVRDFAAYPNIWGLSRPDRNIDHRRVPNLEVFFGQHGRSLQISRNPDDYKPGDLVTWRIPGNLPHIGIVTDRRSADGRHPLIAHNIGRGPQLEDMLFGYPISGHFRYLPEG
jgi:uncharacterized protein YijF (DUF1287 family)